MAIQVTRMWSPDSAGRSPDGRTASASWQVTGVSSSTLALTAVDASTSESPATLNAVYTDQDGTPYPTLKCDNLNVSTTGFEFFVVTASYSVPSDGASHNPEPDNPLDQPAEYVWEVGVTQEAVEVDINNEAIENAAGDPPEQPVTIDVHSIFLNVSRNESSFSPAAAIATTNKINSDTFFGASPGQAKCVGIWSGRTTTEEAVYWPVRYRFEFREGLNGEPNGFKHRMINRGYNMIDGGELKRIVEGDKKGDLVEDAVRDSKPSVSRPRRLAADGSLLGDNDPTVVLEFDVYESTAFGPLNLE
jgi:hypothetical protein